MFEEGRPLVFAVQGIGAWLDHLGRPRCQAGKPGHFSLYSGPSTYPESLHPCIMSLMAQDSCRVTKAVMKPMQMPRGPTNRAREVPIHLTSRRAIEIL